MHLRTQLAGKHGILVLSQEQAVAYTPKSGSVLLRIGHPGEDFLTIPKEHLYLDVQRHQFDDVDTPEFGIVLGNEQAVNIADFIRRHVGLFFVVHCRAGRSRSAACAAAWAAYNGLKEAEADIFKYFPTLNMRVYRTVLEACWGSRPCRINLFP